MSKVPRKTTDKLLIKKKVGYQERRRQINEKFSNKRIRGKIPRAGKDMRTRKEKEEEQEGEEEEEKEEEEEEQEEKEEKQGTMLCKGRQAGVYR